MDRIDAIYQRHVSALARIGIDQDAVRLSLRLALEEMDDGQGAKGDMAAVQLHRLYTWLISHADGRGEGMEIADAMIAFAEDKLAVISSLEYQMHKLAERLRQEARRVIAAEKLAGLPVPVTVEEATNGHANGAGPLDDQTVTALRADDIGAIRASTWLQDTDLDWLEGLERGAHTFRSVPKDVRRRLVQAHLDAIRTDGEAPRQFDFDQSRPAWMPTAGSATMTFGLSWADLCAAKEMP
jgi:hypothetical protein